MNIRFEQSILKAQLWLLSKRFFGGRKWYQFFDFGNGVDNSKYAGVQARERTQSFTDWVDTASLFKEDDRVLDLGSNAGVISIAIATKVGRVTGVEIDKRFCRQARFLQLTLNRRGQFPSNVSLLEGDVLKMTNLVSDSDVIVASKFLYHPNFNRGFDDFFSAIKSSNVRALVVQGHTIYEDFGKEEDVARHLAKLGFTYHSQVGGTDDYPIGVAVRSTV